MLIEIVTPNDVTLSDATLQETCTAVNERLRSGLNSFEIEINYMLRDRLKEIYSAAWIVSAKEYKNSIKIFFRKKEDSEIIISSYEIN